MRIKMCEWKHSYCRIGWMSIIFDSFRILQTRATPLVSLHTSRILPPMHWSWTCPLWPLKVCLTGNMLQLPDPLWFRVGVLWLEACLCHCGCHFIPVLTSSVPVYSDSTVQKQLSIHLSISLSLSIAMFCQCHSMVLLFSVDSICCFLLFYQSICSIYHSVHLHFYHFVVHFICHCVSVNMLIAQSYYHSFFFQSFFLLPYHSMCPSVHLSSVVR